MMKKPDSIPLKKAISCKLPAFYSFGYIVS